MLSLTDLFKRVTGQKLREDCLEEILHAVKREGIEMKNCILTSDNRDLADFQSRSSWPDYAFDNKMRRKLEVVKKRKVPYEIRIGVRGFMRGEYGAIGEVKGEYSAIGEVKNPNYESQKTIYESEVARIHDEFGGHWYITRSGFQYGLYGKATIPEKFRHLTKNKNIYENQQRDVIKGPNDKDWLIYQHRYIEVIDDYRREREIWERTKVDEWTGISNHANLDRTCGNCDGIGIIYENHGTYDLGEWTTSDRCEYCENGKLPLLTWQDCKEIFKPSEINVEFHYLNEKEIIKEAEMNGIQLNLPTPPRKHLPVYMTIVTP